MTHEEQQAAAEKCAAEVAAAQAAKTLPSAKARVLALGKSGVIMPTGIETLDRATRGGPRAGSVIVAGGAPGAGKTTFETKLARHYYQAGHPVAIVASDEAASGILVRWGQLAGYCREALESGDAETLQRFADEVDDRLLIVDQDENDTTLEDVAEKLAAMVKATGKAGVLAIDSMQTVRTAGGKGESPRERLDITVAALKHAAKTEGGVLVLATSEMARGFYRGGGSDATNALAAFKESGGIEYGATIALAMASVKGEGDLVDVEVAKNRTGGVRPTFRLCIDRERADMTEVEMPPEASDESRAAARESADEARVEQLANEIERALVSSGGRITSRPDLQNLVSGTNALRVRAVSLLIREGRIEGGNGKPYRRVAVRGVA